MPIRQGRTDPKIGPSDTTDTFYDNPAGVTDSDTGQTGEDAGGPGRGDVRKEAGTDRVVDDREAGLGGGLDQAEEARLKRERKPATRAKP